MRQPYFANVLIDVVLPVQTVSTPGERRRSGVILFPRPEVQASGRLTTPNVVIDTGVWFVFDERASTLPVQCTSQTAAQLAADTWANNVTTESVDPTNAVQVSNWCRWFVDKHPDCAILAPFADTPAVDAMTMAGSVWPTGTDAEAAAELTTSLPALDNQTQIEALLTEGQADHKVTEEAS